MISPTCIMVTLRCTEHPPTYSWYPHIYHRIPPGYSWNPPDALKTHIIQGGFTAPRAICRSNKKEDTRKNYVTLDWLSTHCSLSQNLFLPCNTKFFIIHLSTNNVHLFQANCAPQCSVVKINACCLTLAIWFFILLSQPLSVPCLFEKVYWEGKHLAEIIYFQNGWGG